MKEFNIKSNEAGQRFDKYLQKLLNKAPKSFIYKMLRKKNFKLNNKKANGDEILELNDNIKIYLSDETYNKFVKDVELDKYSLTKKIDIIYEDEDIILINKPINVLCQSDGTGQKSMVEYVIGYLLESNQLTKEDLKTFKPSVCNRLDRNTSGLLSAGKSLKGLQELSKIFKEHSIKKYYVALVYGTIKEPSEINGFLYKDEKTNRVKVLKEPFKDALPIITRYKPLYTNGELTLLEVNLITGRTHQIRSHLASIGLPIIGDFKYGNKEVNKKFKEKYKLTNQLLHCEKYIFPNKLDKLKQLEGKTFKCELPNYFKEIINKEGIKEKANE